jgi:hypothetical protein
MITEAELLEHKWRKVENKCWEKLGVRIEYPICMGPFSVIKLTYYVNPEQESYSAIYIPIDINMNTLENIITNKIKFIFSVGPQRYPITLKQKRTLKNWIL